MSYAQPHAAKLLLAIVQVDMGMSSSCTAGHYQQCAGDVDAVICAK